jgi:hypothetical protein
MYPTSDPDDAVCGDFSIREAHKPAVPMIAFAEQHLVVLCRFPRYAAHALRESTKWRRRLRACRHKKLV